eukprot:UN12214
MMTGNTVALGIAVVDGNWSRVALYVAIIFCFFAGALVGWACEPPARRRAGSFRYISVLIVFCLSLCEVLVHFLDSADDQRWASLLTAVAMGVTDVVAFHD